ncbi:hypothetical protein TRFO_20785 [Tritrichomonas foetus]|uniref:Auxin Efflux Carrier family protein n=1 Tax=Tritrichomonas foetus TaxID=1144522 RepID=A0A1J4KGJ7_9EUKA|nr:hypothetical protein TRFO_20785 [Tritrichomonas foetus]|eukprot:OHT10064.1 hypothetical protein TRFO_20785 [Tritrichomonas foetus]
MSDYLATVNAGVSVLLIIIVGYVCTWLKIVPAKDFGTLNLFTAKCCFFFMTFRSLAGKDKDVLDFRPLAISVLMSLTLYLIFAIIIFLPFNDSFGLYISIVFPTVYVNYFISGLPIFLALWDESETAVITVILIANDLMCSPIFLTLAKIHELRIQRQKRKTEQMEMKSIDDNIEGDSYSTTSSELESSSISQKQTTEKNNTSNFNNCKNNTTIHQNHTALSETHKNHDQNVNITESDSIEEESAEINIDKKKKKDKINNNDDDDDHYIKKLLLEILNRLIHNMFLVGIVFGMIYLAITSKTCTFLKELMNMLGDCVLPFALFNVGAFLSTQSLIACHWAEALVSLIGRLILGPFLAGIYCYALGFPGRLSQQCIILASMPTAATCFTMTDSAGIGSGVSSTMIMWSAVFMVPVTVFWMWILEVTKLFEE